MVPIEPRLQYALKSIIKQEGNGPIDSRAKIISEGKLGQKFEIRVLNYPGNHVHVAETLSLISSNGKQTAEGKQTADHLKNSKFSYPTTLYYI